MLCYFMSEPLDCVYIYILFFIFFSIMVYYGLLNIWIFASKILFTYSFFGMWYLSSLARN